MLTPESPLPIRDNEFRPQTIEGLDRRKRLRFRSTEEPVFQQLRQEIGDRGLLDLIHESANELRGRTAIHRRLYGEIYEAAGLIASRAGILESFGPNRIPTQSPAFFLKHMMGRRSPLAGSDIDLKQTLTDLDLHPIDTGNKTEPTTTLRRACILKSAAIQDMRSQAMTTNDRRFLAGGDVTYARGQMWQELLTEDYAAKLRAHYGIADSDNHFIHLTAKGMQAPILAITSLIKAYPNLRIVLLSAPYFETNKFLGRLKRFGAPVPEVTRVKAESLKDTIDQFGAWANEDRPVALLADAIGSNPGMEVCDIGGILEAASGVFRGRTPFFMISDLTTTGGVYQIFDESKRIIEGSRVNIIAPQSLLKYLEYGWDLTQLGAVIGLGPQCNQGGQFNQRMIEVYNLWKMDPDLAAVALMPPVDSDYLSVRAKQIDRNASVIIEHLQKMDIPNDFDLQISYPPLNSENQDALADIGFNGAYFFLRLPPGAAEKVMAYIENDQPPSWGYIESGVSFGFDATRVQRIGNWLRITPGTEDILIANCVATNLVMMIKALLTGNR